MLFAIQFWLSITATAFITTLLIGLIGEALHKGARLPRL